MNWITDRTPRREEADGWGEVVVLSGWNNEEGSCWGWNTNAWHSVKLGTPWLPFVTPEQSPKSEQRSFTQIVIGSGSGYAVALADDGTAWQYVPRDHTWRQLPSLPKRQQEDS